MNDHQMQVGPASVPLSLLSTHQNSGMPFVLHSVLSCWYKRVFYFWVDHLASDSFAFEYYLAEFNITIERHKGKNWDALMIFSNHFFALLSPPNINKAICSTIHSVINELPSFIKVLLKSTLPVHFPGSCCSELVKIPNLIDWLANALMCSSSCAPRQGSCTPDRRCRKLNVYTIKNLFMSLKS